MLRRITWVLLAALLWCCAGCSGSGPAVYIPEEPDYRKGEVWYARGGDGGTDVFYVTPTCIFDWKDGETGLLCHHYDVNRGKMKENFDYSLRLAEGIFGRDCRFYAPYYRQISLESWLEGEEVIEDRFRTAMEDVEKAFRHYMSRYNQGRPFVLAGYSQGAKAVVELVKRLGPGELARMKAAYVIGYRIDEEDLRNPNIRPATGEADQGVVVCYNSVRSSGDIWDAVAKGNRICINPVNWRTDGTPAVLEGGIGVKVDVERMVLEVSGYDGGGIHIPLLDGYVTEGNYHLSELTLYGDCLRRNLSLRIR